ncbi:MAG: radical SAM protein [Desulfobacterales bacterium]
MSDELFIQFLSRSRRGYWDLANGFSDTHDLCRSRGELWWVEHEPESEKWYMEKTYTSRELPVEKATVYVSASYINHLYQAYVWARMYPGINFVAGGPVAAARGCDAETWEPLYFEVSKDAQLPQNLTITGKSVENLFGVPDFSGTWRLDLPEDFVSPQDPVYISYTLDNGCYWGRCIYCNIKEAPRELFRQRKKIGFEFAELDHPGRKIVRLNTGSITPKYIKDVLANLPVREDLEYRTFMRCSAAENRALAKVLAKREEKFPELTLGIGIEFPSDRMLAYMDKGITTEDILETLGLCKRYGIKVNGNMILGWGNLEDRDLRDMERFLESMPEDSLTSVQLRWLYAHPHTGIHRQYQGEPEFLGPFYLGFRVNIPQRQKRLNSEAVRLIRDFASEKGFRIEGLANVIQDPGGENSYGA